MKTTLLTILVVVCGALASANAQLLQYNFNQGSGQAVNSGSVGAAGNLSFGSAASWGASGSGVGGGSGNYSYQGIREATASENSYASTSGNISALNGLTAMTITGWINTSAWGINGESQFIMSNYEGTWPNGFWLSTAAGGQMILNLGNNGPTTSTGGNFDNYLDQWMFFAAAWDADSGTVGFYYGTTAAAAVADSTVNDNGNASTGTVSTASFFVGSGNGHPWWESIPGGLDDLRIYGSRLDAAAIEGVRESALVPEPHTLGLLLLAGAALLGKSRARRRVAA